jgi:hypothetical protein
MEGSRKMASTYASIWSFRGFGALNIISRRADLGDRGEGTEEDEGDSISFS